MTCCIGAAFGFYRQLYGEMASDRLNRLFSTSIKAFPYTRSEGDLVIYLGIFALIRKAVQDLKVASNRVCYECLNLLHCQVRLIILKWRGVTVSPLYFIVALNLALQICSGRHITALHRSPYASKRRFSLSSYHQVPEKNRSQSSLDEVCWKVSSWILVTCS